MGRIKSALVKRTSKKLDESEDIKSSFSPDFSQNKLVLGSTMPSKRIRNKIAGYISRLEKAKKQ